MKSDIEIAQEAKMKPIADIAASLGLADEDVIPYGRYKAKVNHRLIHKASKQGKLILVTAISPTPAGEGKTTTSVGLADAMNAIGKKTMLCLREPSLGPVFGMKGGAAGGGYAQVVPMEDINLHFTGDIHAIGTANNLLAAMIDNSIQQGNPLNIDPRRITWKRCMDMNDRQLRFIVDGLGGKVNGTPREDGFDITVASEIMAVLCLSSDLADLKARLARIVVGYTYDDRPVTAGDLKAVGAMAAFADEDSYKFERLLTLLRTAEDKQLLSMIGEIDLSDGTAITFTYLDRFTVKMPWDADIAYKLGNVRTVVEQLEANQTGTINLMNDGRADFIPE